MKLTCAIVLGGSCLVFFNACEAIPPNDAPAETEINDAKGGLTESAPGVVSFETSIKPILANKCTICHNTEVLPKRPNFETRAGVMASGVIVPGSPDESLFLKAVQEAPHADKAMPPVSHRLTKPEISLVRQWITEGAHWPAGEAGRVVPAFIPKE